MKIIFFTALLLSLMLSYPALANCIAQSVQSGDYRVTAQWPATVTLWSGTIDKGCMVELKDGGEKVLAYSEYDFICALPESEEIELKLLPACCDTLPHSGMPCGAKRKDETGVAPAPRTNLMAVPDDPDRREIPELVNKISTGQFYLPDAERLAEFMDDGDFEEDIAKYETQIRKAYHQMPDGYMKTEVARLWLDTDAGEKMLSDRGDDIDDTGLLKGMEKIYDKQLLESLNQLRSKPRKPEKFMPVLIDRLHDLSALRRIATMPDDREIFDALLDTFEAYGPAAKDYLQQAYFALNNFDVFDAYGIPKEARMQALMSGRNIPAYGRPHTYRKNSVANGDDEIAAIVVPRFEKLVCTIAPPASGSKTPQVNWNEKLEPPPVKSGRKTANALPPPFECD